MLMILPSCTVIFAMVTSLPNRDMPQLPGFSHNLPSFHSSLYRWEWP